MKSNSSSPAQPSPSKTRTAPKPTAWRTVTSPAASTAVRAAVTAARATATETLMMISSPWMRSNWSRVRRRSWRKRVLLMDRWVCLFVYRFSLQLSYCCGQTERRPVGLLFICKCSKHSYFNFKKELTSMELR